MSIVLAVALQLLPFAHDPDFAARVTRGKLIEVGPTGAAYQKQMWDQITGPMTTALKACIARNTPADKSPFTVVADVQPDGHPVRVAAEPATPVASCLSSWFATLTLPLPPKLADGGVYAIEIDVSITH
jgi:hypothetical protein